MPKNYPAFIIDRCREYIDGISYDYIACTDKTVGFVARVYSVRRTASDTINSYIDSFPTEEAEVRFIVATVEHVAIVLEIVSFLQSPKFDSQERSRIKSLLKKAARKYLAYIMKHESPYYKDGNSLVNQIKVLDDVLHTANGQMKQLTSYMGETNAKHYVDCIRAAVESLKALQEIQKFAQ